jgi:hypothetical protein
MNNSKLAGWLTILSTRLKLLTLKYNVCYLAEGRFLRLAKNGQLVSTVELEAQSGPFVILARRYYHEFSKTYPIRSKKDLAEILQLEYQDQVAIHLLRVNDQQGIDVQSYVLKSDAVALLNKPCVIVPESWLITATQEDDAITLVEHQVGSYFTFRFQNNFGSVLKTSLCHDMATVRFIHGLPENVKGTTVTQSELPGLLANAFVRSRLSILAGLTYLPTAFLQRLQWKPWLAAGTVLMLVYLSLASWFIGWQQQQYAAKIATLGPEVDVLLQSQSDIERLSAELTDTGTKASTFKPFYPVWSILLTLIESGIEVRDFSMDGGEYNISGQAERATEVLSALIAMPGVKSAEFSAPTRRDLAKDQFSIRFSLQSAGVTDAK